MKYTGKTCWDKTSYIWESIQQILKYRKPNNNIALSQVVPCEFNDTVFLDVYNVKDGKQIHFVSRLGSASSMKKIRRDLKQYKRILNKK